MNTRRASGDVVLDVRDIGLAFGGVKALSDISFDVREHEVRAIIGPNGAGKSSMLNCINGVYQPQQGSIAFRGKTFRHMNPRQVAEMGIARTFQNLALFKGMSVLDNIMTGRNLKMRANLFWQALRDLLALGRADADRLQQQVAAHLQVAPGHEVVEHAHALEQRQVLERARDAHLGHLARVHVAEGAAAEGD